MPILKYVQQCYVLVVLNYILVGCPCIVLTKKEKKLLKRPVLLVSQGSLPA